MSYNIHHGEGPDKRLDLERIAKVITHARADIVGLQEIDRGCERTQKRDWPAELGCAATRAPKANSIRPKTQRAELVQVKRCRSDYFL